MIIRKFVNQTVMNKSIYVAMLFALALAPGCRNSGGELKEGKLEYGEEVCAVDVVELKKTDFPRQIVSNGKLTASEAVSLRFGTSGTVKTLNVRNGQRVAAGQLIAELDRPDLDIALHSAQLSLDKARLDFYDILAGQGYSAADSLSVPEEVLKMARIRSGYGAALNALERSRYDRSCARLAAPFSGRIADLKTSEHDQTSSDVFCRLLNDSRLNVDFTVMEFEYPFLSDGLPVVIVPFSDASKSFRGRICAVNPAVDSKGQVAVRASVEGAAGLVDGMNVKVTFEKTVPGQLVVPRSAVVIRDNMNVLFTYRPEDGTAGWVYVNVLASNRDSFVVEANRDRGAHLEEGELVIVSSNLNLADGSKVCLKKD